MKKIITTLIAITLTLILITQLTACSSYIDPQKLDKFHYKNSSPTAPSDSDENAVKVQYLGVSGYLITHDGYKLLLGPSFTNPGYGTLLWSLFSGDLQADEGLIKQFYPVKGRDDPKAKHQDVEAILVGHSHYDHLLDVPYIMKNFTKSATAYGSKTMQSLLRTKKISNSKIFVLNDIASEEHNHKDTNWRYVSDNRIRFLALKSDHAPLVGKKVFAQGSYDGQDLNQQLNFLQWKLGQTFSFLIDLLDDKGNITYRIHYVDTSSKPRHGYLPQSVLDEKRVDLAILCLAGFGKSGDYPKGIVEHLNPKTIIAGHWEHFFGNQGKTQRVVFGSDHQEFLKRLNKAMPKDSQWIIPRPLFELKLPVGGN